MISVKKYLRNRKLRKDWSKLTKNEKMIFSFMGISPKQCEVREKREPVKKCPTCGVTDPYRNHHPCMMGL